MDAEWERQVSECSNTNKTTTTELGTRMGEDTLDPPLNSSEKRGQETPMAECIHD